MTEEHYDKRKYYKIKYATPFEISLLPVKYWNRMQRLWHAVKIRLRNIQRIYDSFESIHSNIFVINNNIEKYLEQKLNKIFLYILLFSFLIIIINYN